MTKRTKHTKLGAVPAPIPPRSLPQTVGEEASTCATSEDTSKDTSEDTSEDSKDEDVKIIRPRGRPRKYATEAEAKQAQRERTRVWKKAQRERDQKARGVYGKPRTPAFYRNQSYRNVKIERLELKLLRERLLALSAHQPELARIMAGCRLDATRAFPSPPPEGEEPAQTT